FKRARGLVVRLVRFASGVVADRNPVVVTYRAFYEYIFPSSESRDAHDDPARAWVQQLIAVLSLIQIPDGEINGLPETDATVFAVNKHPPHHFEPSPKHFEGKRYALEAWKNAFRDCHVLTDRNA